MAAHLTKGVLVTCDPVTTQYLKFKDQDHNFIIKVVDERHVFVHADKQSLIEDLIYQWQEENELAS